MAITKHRKASVVAVAVNTLLHDPRDNETEIVGFACKKHNISLGAERKATFQHTCPSYKLEHTFAEFVRVMQQKDNKAKKSRASNGKTKKFGVGSLQ